MSKIFIALTFLFASATSAFAAGNDAIFFGKLGLLIALNVVLGGVLTLFAVALASTLLDKVRRSLPRPVQARPARDVHRGERTETEYYKKAA